MIRMRDNKPASFTVNQTFGKEIKPGQKTSNAVIADPECMVCGGKPIFTNQRTKTQAAPVLILCHHQCGAAWHGECLKKWNNAYPVPEAGVLTSCSFIQLPVPVLPDPIRERASRSGAAVVTVVAGPSPPIMNVPNGFTGKCPAVNEAIQTVTFSAHPKRVFQTLLTPAAVSDDAHDAQKHTLEHKALKSLEKEQAKEEARKKREQAKVNAKASSTKKPPPSPRLLVVRSRVP